MCYISGNIALCDIVCATSVATLPAVLDYLLLKSSNYVLIAIALLFIPSSVIKRSCSSLHLLCQEPFKNVEIWLTLEQHLHSCTIREHILYTYLRDVMTSNVNIQFVSYMMLKRGTYALTQ